MEIKREKIENFEDCHSYCYWIVDENKKIKFYQSGNRDLNMIFYSNNISDNKLEITKNNYLLYKVLVRLYDQIINFENYMTEVYSEQYIEIIKKTIYKDLVHDCVIDWMSDAPTSQVEQIYNHLQIKKENETIVLEFINNANKNHVGIEFNTDRSRYKNFIIPFINLLNDFKEITEPYRQITIDEYLEELENKKKVKK